MLGPAVNQHSAHGFVGRGLEHAQHHTRRGVVAGLVAGGAVIGLNHVVKLRQGAVARPQSEPVPLDDARLFRVNDVRVYLLPTERGALILKNVLPELGRKVINVVVGAGFDVHDVLAIALNKVYDQGLGLRGGRADDARGFAEAHAELNHIP